MAKRPEWISKNEDGKDSILRAEPDIAVQNARFGNKYPPRSSFDAEHRELDPDHDARAHLYQLTIAQFFADARTLADWHTYSESYPDQALDDNQTVQQANPNVAVRAYYLAEALTKLIELVEGPSAMAGDLRTILKPFLATGAEGRAEVQKAILEDPSMSLRQIAGKKRAGQISKDGKAGLIRWPADTER